MLDHLTTDVLDAHSHVIATLWEMDTVGIKLFYANRKAREVTGVDPRTEDIYLCDLMTERTEMCQYAREMMRIANTQDCRVAEMRQTPFGMMYVEAQRLGSWILYLAYDIRALADEMTDFVEAGRA